MIQDDVIRMAKTVGDVSTDSRGRMDFCFDEYGLLAFAKLIAAKEREACAKVCEDASTPNVGELQSDGQWGAFVCAVAIRARGEQT